MTDAPTETLDDAALERAPRPPWGDRLQTAVGRIVYSIDAAGRGGLGTGDVAALRRLSAKDGSKTTDLAFWRLVVEHLEPADLIDESDPREVRRWMSICQALAQLQGLRGKTRLGQAMALAGISDVRLSKLLRASGDRLLDEVRSVAHLLHAKGQRVEPVSLARLVVTEDQERGDEVRRVIALDFYRLADSKPDTQSGPNAAEA